MPQPSARSRPRSRSAQLAEFPDAAVRRSNACGPECAARDRQADAAMEQAKAWHRIADVGEAALEAFKPAADTIHGFGIRLDALCKWLTGKWPWIAVTAMLLVARTINAAPGEFPKLIEAGVALIKTIWG